MVILATLAATPFFLLTQQCAGHRYELGIIYREARWGRAPPALLLTALEDGVALPASVTQALSDAMRRMGSAQRVASLCRHDGRAAFRFDGRAIGTDDRVRLDVVLTGATLAYLSLGPQ